LNVDSRDKNDATDDGRYSALEEKARFDEEDLVSDMNDKRLFVLVVARARMADR
jgi:hypothetical protein